MLDRLPHLIDPIAFADKQRTLQGQIPLAKLSRLADKLLDSNGQVEISLSFSKEGRLSVVRGHIKTTLTLECRTCLGSLSLPLALDVNLAVVHSLEQAERLSGEYEPLMIKEEKIPLHEVVEDELLLALPDFPRHENECTPYVQTIAIIKSVETNKTTEQQSQSNNPFSVLAKLKNIGD
jgi:uncharacterized protein